VKRIHIIVTGIVQGVGFRHYAGREAEKLHLTGSVRNKADGSVEIEAQGTVEALESFLTWVKHGPRNAVVESFKKNEMTVANEENNFEIKTN